MTFMLPTSDGTLVDLPALWAAITEADCGRDAQPAFGAGLVIGLRLAGLEPGISRALLALFERDAAAGRGLAPEQIEEQATELIRALLDAARVERDAA